ncbi:unnamed protein product [Nesidiocoris tenuis]|uniref:Uncharacterized protein n=1 Tax=Nesidiocoris tenuis TaxID=355587 RepID=A0A6H5G8X4_9HEMI|nr:unnamed protein product [Nesidiocoris tenuis]
MDWLQAFNRRLNLKRPPSSLAFSTWRRFIFTSTPSSATILLRRFYWTNQRCEDNTQYFTIFKRESLTQFDRILTALKGDWDKNIKTSAPPTALQHPAPQHHLPGGNGEHFLIVSRSAATTRHPQPLRAGLQGSQISARSASRCPFYGQTEPGFRIKLRLLLL